MAWITIPNVFRGKGGQRVPVAQVDDDFQYLADKLNAFNPTGAPAGPGGIYSVRNLVGVNNGGAPTVAYDWTADAILLRNPADGSFIVRTNVTLANDITTAGPTPNGRDQVTAFAVSVWIHWYAIWNPTTSTLATLASLTPPPTGPAMPSGFTMWAYLGANILDAGGLLNPVYTRGADMIWTIASQVVASASPLQNVETAVDVSTSVPPNALSFRLNVGAAYFNGSTSGTNLLLRVVTTEDVCPLRGTVFAGSGGSITAQLTLPNLGQQYLYLWSVDVVSGPTFVTDQWVSSFRVPNGGE